MPRPQTAMRWRTRAGLRRCLATRRGARGRPRDAAGHQPRLRLPPLPAGHPGHRLAGDAGSGSSSPPGRPRTTSCAAFGFERVHLQLGRGSNPGVIRAEEQPRGEDDALRGLLRRDPARRRRDPRLPGPGPRQTTCCGTRWRSPGRCQRVVDRVRPDARHRRPPRLQRPAGVWPARASATPTSCSGTRRRCRWATRCTATRRRGRRAFTPDPSRLADLRRAVRGGPGRLHRAVERRAPRALDPAAQPSAGRLRRDRRRAAAQLPGRAARRRPHALLPAHAFLGSAVRSEARGRAGRGLARAPTAGPSSTSASAASSRCAATCSRGWRGAARPRRARGARRRAPPRRPSSGAVPQSWLVREMLPQVTLLREAALAVSHGGNNSVTEALTAGVPLLAAAPLHRPVRRRRRHRGGRHRRGAGPQRGQPVRVRSAADRLLSDPSEARRRLTALAKSLTTWTGAERALDALTREPAETGTPGRTVR